MAHQIAPSVNCSLDEIDLNALKVCTSLCIYLWPQTFNQKKSRKLPTLCNGGPMGLAF